MTTRKHLPALAVLSCALALFVSGCATPGPTHAYVAGRAQDPIIDLLPGSPDAEIPGYLDPVNELYGIAYDPFTDHLFLRVFPGDFIRVIDRPARQIKRSFFVDSLPAGRGDLAIRSSDRHLFFAHPGGPQITETTLHGRVVRTITLENLQGAPDGLAYDQKNDRLLVLKGGDLPHIGTYDLTGKRLSGIALDRDVRLLSLAYDSTTAEFYALLLNQPAVGIFDAQGRLLRTLPTSSADTHHLIDVGQRSLLRLF